MKKKILRVFYTIAGFYDGLLGLYFLFFSAQVFERYQVPPPNHFGYIHFPAIILIVFAIMFFEIAYRLEKSRNLILYGILLKISYCSVVFYHWFSKGIPSMWKPFAIIDFAFLILFLLSYKLFRKY